MKNETERNEEALFEDQLNSLKIVKPSVGFDSRMNELFADAKYYRKHNKSKTVYFWISGIAASVVIVFVLTFCFNFSYVIKSGNGTLIKPEYISQTPVMASIIKLDSKSDDFFTLSRRDHLKDIFKREIMSVKIIE